MPHRRAFAARPIFASPRFWLGPVAAGLTYLSLRYGAAPLLSSLAPAAVPGQLNLGAMACGAGGQVAPIAAPWIALLMLCGWLRALPGLWRRLAQAREISDLESLRALTWREFEELVADTYRAQGYEVVETGGGGPDGGVDVVLRKDGIRLLVQCKQWKTTQVGVKPARELFGLVAARRAHGGIVVTCGGYTREALLFANDKRLQLLDGHAVLRMVRETAPVSPEDARRGDAAGAASVAVARAGAAPNCPICRGKMVVRATRGRERVGERFWGCRAHPRCRGMRPLETAGIRVGDTLEPV